MKNRRIYTIFGAILGCALALVACRAEEQGRITHYKPGVYLGKKDAQLGEAKADDLRQRAAPQGDSNYRSPGGGLGVKSDVDTRTLDSRTQQQGGSKP